MSTGNKAIPDLPAIPDPTGGSLYITKDNVDFRVDTGGIGGLATLGSDGKISSDQMPSVTSIPWSGITSKPTTLSGYGITDNTFANLGGKPTTIAGYGITDNNWTNLTGKPTTFAPAAHDASLITSGSISSARISGSYSDFTNITASGNIGGFRFRADRAVQTAPAFSFTDDTNTGIWSSGENNLDIVCGSVNRVNVSASGVAVAGAISATGNVTGYSSDKRLKTNIENIKDPMEKLYKIGGYTFDWNEPLCFLAGFHPDNVHEHGVLAQEVQKIMPDAVTPAAFDPRYLTVNYARLVPLLIECIKDLQSQIDELKKD